MEIKRAAVAGTLESNDVLVSVTPSDRDGVGVTLDSIVGQLYGEEIIAMVRSRLADLGVRRAEVSLRDRGALDFAIRARVETAVRRAGEEETDA